MADETTARLYVKGSFLRHQLRHGTDAQIRDARNQLRALMISHQGDGYWRSRPELLRQYMDLLYRCDRILSSLGPGLALAKRAYTPLHNQVS
jgi:hypothetical protein